MPGRDELVYQHGFQIQGWVRTDDGRRWRAVVARLGEHVVGATALPLARPDVANELGFADGDLGFVVRCTVAEALRGAPDAELALDVVDADGTWIPFAIRRIRFSEIDYRIHSHAEVVADLTPRVLKRSDVYLSGPPSQMADSICTELIMRYLKPGDRVLDVGCGVGAYERPLSVRGIEWTGCEANPEFVELMRSRGLQATLSATPLPFADGSFDATICIEVLEHIDDYEPFIADVARVSRRAALFSVPNFGAIPIASSMYALPYHMLEPDHKNFFTVRSLAAVLERHYRHVETFEYGPLALLRSHDGIAINNHVFAVAMH